MDVVAFFFFFFFFSTVKRLIAINLIQNNSYFYVYINTDIYTVYSLKIFTCTVQIYMYIYIIYFIYI